MPGCLKGMICTTSLVSSLLFSSPLNFYFAQAFSRIETFGQMGFKIHSMKCEKMAPAYFFSDRTGGIN